jgi:hypothetical protein
MMLATAEQNGEIRKHTATSATKEPSTSSEKLREEVLGISSHSTHSTSALESSFTGLVVDSSLVRVR